MKKIGILMLMLLIVSGSFIGCKSFNDDDNTNNEQQAFEANVIESGDRLLISPDKDSVAYSSADKISVATIETEIIDDKGNTAEIDILNPGDRIKVFYNGVIAESYPAQITADRIELLGRNYVIDGFIALIDDVYQEDSGLNSDITMIAFDTTEWTELSESETEIILAIAKDEYALEVVVGTFDELAEKKLIDKDNLYFESGILVEIKEIEINNNKDKIKCSIRKWRSGLGAIGWDAEAKLDKSEWKITRDNMWIS
jgi:hypothetical protein